MNQPDVHFPDNWQSPLPPGSKDCCHVLPAVHSTVVCHCLLQMCELLHPSNHWCLSLIWALWVWSWARTGLAGLHGAAQEAGHQHFSSGPQLPVSGKWLAGGGCHFSPSCHSWGASSTLSTVPLRILGPQLPLSQLIRQSLHTKRKKTRRSETTAPISHPPSPHPSTKCQTPKWEYHSERRRSLLSLLPDPELWLRDFCPGREISHKTNSC